MPALLHIPVERRLLLPSFLLKIVIIPVEIEVGTATLSRVRTITHGHRHTR
jgi:hypothetical protein